MLQPKRDDETKRSALRRNAAPGRRPAAAGDSRLPNPCQLIDMPGFAARLVIAASEAASSGGLADWFA